MKPNRGYHLTADYHTHTVHSHGTGTVADNARAAAARGLLEVAITDHGPALAAGAGLRSPGALRRQRQEVEEANRLPGGVRVLQGVEANLMDTAGTLDLPRRVLDRLDIVLAGIHPAAGHPGRWGAVKGMAAAALLPLWAPREARRRAADYTKGLAEAIIRNPVDILVHPGLRQALDLPELARAAGRAGVALEINATHGHLTVAGARQAAKAGCLFALNSDAHRPSDVGGLAAAARLAKLAGIEPDRIVNAVLPGGGHCGRAGGGWGRRT